MYSGASQEARTMKLIRVVTRVGTWLSTMAELRVRTRRTIMKLTTSDTGSRSGAHRLLATTSRTSSGNPTCRATSRACVTVHVIKHNALVKFAVGRMGAVVGVIHMGKQVTLPDGLLAKPTEVVLHNC